MLTFAHLMRRRLQLRPIVPSNLPVRRVGQPHGACYAAATLALLSALGCKCGADDHPYTPFGVASSVAPASDTAVVPTATTASPAFKPITSSAVSPPSPTFAGSGYNLQAPEGLAFARVLDARLGPDAKAELIAWLIPLSANSSTPASLWAFTEGAGARQLTKLPGFVPTGKDCTQRVDLQQTGPSTVTLDVGAQCKSPGIPRAPTRSLTVLEPLAAGRQVLQLRLAEPPSNETVSLMVISTDRDADGHDDVRLELSLQQSAGHNPATAGLTWLDRTAGATRDASEPMRALGELAKADRARAGDAKGAAAASERVDNARRWFAFVCAEAQSYRLSDADGKPLQCGDAQTWLDLQLQAEVRAAITQKDWAQALWRLERADWTLGKPSPKLLEELTTQLVAAMPTKKARFERLDTSALGSGSEPRMSPLAYNAKGELFVQTREGVMSIATSGAAAATDALDPWPLIVLGPGERRITGLELPCDRANVRVMSQDPEGRFFEALGTQLSAPRPGACAGTGTFFDPELRVVGWSELEPDLFIGPLRFGHRLALGAPGGPTSPDGGSSVAVTKLGLFVRHGEHSELWQPSAPIELQECVINDATTQAACLEGTRVVRLRPL